MSEPSRVRRFARAMAYPTFFFGCFVTFCYWTFPYDRLKEFLVARVNHPVTAAGRPVAPTHEIAIEDLDPYFLTGVELTSVRLRRLPAGPEDARTVPVNLPRVTVRASVFPLLLGKVVADIRAETATGDVEAMAAVGFDGSLRALRADLSQVNLRHFASAGLAGKVPLKGILGGEVDLDFSSGKANGTIQFDVRGLEVGDGVTRVPLPGTVLSGGLTLDTLRAGNLRIEAVFADGEARVQRLEARGPDVTLRGLGTIHLDRDPRLVRLDLFLSARFEEAYKQKSDRTRSMFQLMEMNARMRQARTSDGSWQFRLRGSPATQLIPEPAGRERFPAR